VALSAAAFLFVDRSATACDRCKAHGACCACPAACEPAPCAPCQPVEYDERKITVYDVSFREIVEEKVVKTTKFVPDVEERDVTMTCWEEKVTPCGPANACGPASCCQCCEKVPFTCIRKVKVPVIREVPAEEKIKVTRIVEDRIPRTIVCRVPKAPPCQPAPCEPACGCK
jgi:hypothetical protein